MTDWNELIEQWEDLKDNIPSDHAEAAELLWDMGDKLADALEDEQCAVVENLDAVAWKIASLVAEWSDGMYEIPMAGSYDIAVKIISAITIRPAAEVAAEAKAEEIEAAVVVAYEWWERCVEMHDDDGAFSAQEIIERIRSIQKLDAKQKQ